jgi:hypothetical protein
VCENGFASTTYVQFKVWQSGTHSELLVRKHFVCADGTFDLVLHVTSYAATDSDAGTWAVTDG